VAARLPKNAWTLRHAFEYALNKPASDGGWRGARWEPDVRRIAEQLKSYFGASFPISDIRRAQVGDGPRSKTIDGFVELCRAGHFTTRRLRKDGKPAEYKPRLNRNGTVNRKLDVLKKALRLAVAFKALDAIPEFPQRPREGRKRIRFYTRREERTLLAGLLAGANSPRVIDPDGWREAHDQICVLIDAGVRWGELDAILPEHICKSRRELFVPGIEDSGQQNDDLDRVVPLTARAFEILDRRCRDGVKPFKLGYHALAYRFDKVKFAIALSHDKRFTIHTARHTFCSRLAQQGVESAIIKDLAGHKIIATTLRYIHLNTKSRRAAIDAMEASKDSDD
jgi:integrase